MTISGILIRVRTEEIRLMTFDLTLVLSEGPPNAGSCCVEPQPILARKRSSERMAIALTSNTET